MLALSSPLVTQFLVAATKQLVSLFFGPLLGAGFLLDRAGVPLFGEHRFEGPVVLGRVGGFFIDSVRWWYWNWRGLISSVWRRYWRAVFG
jgi:hypothetical protein